MAYDAVVAEVGGDAAASLRDLTLSVYARAEEIARERGIILADTKLEFGRDSDGKIVLGDEVLTPDSSRFWPAGEWEPGRTQSSYDKQIVRNWLLSEESGWDRSSGRGAAPAAAARRRPDPGAVRRGVRAAHRLDVLIVQPVSVDFDAPVDVVFAYLVDPANRPAWQGSLRRTVDLVGDGSVGTTWTDVTAVGARPRMRVTELTPGRSWAETGSWHGVDADLRLDFEPIHADPSLVNDGSASRTRVTATIDVRTSTLLAPVGVVLRRLAPGAVRGDLRRAARTVGS